MAKRCDNYRLTSTENYVTLYRICENITYDVALMHAQDFLDIHGLNYVDIISETTHELISTIHYIPDEPDYFDDEIGFNPYLGAYDYDC